MVRYPCHYLCEGRVDTVRRHLIKASGRTRFAGPAFYLTVLTPAAAALTGILAIVLATLPNVRITAGQFQVLTLGLLASLAIYLVGDKLPAIRAQETVEVLLSHQELYLAAASVLRQEPSSPDSRFIWAASIFPEEEIIEVSGVTREYGEAYAGRIMSTTQPWQVRHVYFVDSHARLDGILAELEGRKDAPDYEVRCYVGNSRLRPLSPLVVGGTVFLSLQDRRLGRGEMGMRVEGPAAARFACEYFSRLWDEAEHKLRTQKGVNEAGVRSARGALDLEPPSAVRKA